MAAGGPGGIWRHPRIVLAVLVLGGYIGISRGVGHLFPFSTFDMYSGRGSSGSRVIAQTADGGVAEVDRYRDWECPEPLDVDRSEPCSAPESYVSIRYKEQETLDWIMRHGGHDPAAEDVKVIRRIWRLSDGDARKQIEDCVLGRCRAVRR